MTTLEQKALRTCQWRQVRVVSGSEKCRGEGGVGVWAD